MTRPAERPRRGLWRTEVVRATLSGHSILGIAFAAIIYIVCLSGTLCVFMRDFQRWEQPDAPVVRIATPDATARAIAAMGARAGSERAIYVSLPDDGFPRLMLSTGDEAGGETWFADTAGRLTVRQDAPWTDFVSDLHTQLHLPETWGRFIVGLAGVALVSSLISGILSHPRVFRDAFHLRLGGSRRLEQADIHNRLGVWALPFHLIVSLTGALLGLSTVIVGALALLLFRGDSEKVYALLAPPPPRSDARPAPMPDIATMIATARARAPDAEPRQLVVTHLGRRDAHVEISSSRPNLIAEQDSIGFDALGHVTNQRQPSDTKLGDRILGSLGQLHFGWFGGIAIRVVYGALGLALCVVTSSGINVWLARRRDKGRAAPTLERIWAAIAWGQPAIFALSALIAKLFATGTDAGVLTILWAGMSVLTVGLSAVVSYPTPHLERAMRTVTGILCVLIALAGFWIGGTAMDGGYAMAIDVSILLLAFSLVVGKRQKLVSPYTSNTL